jgi:type II secretory pathway component GspD/PulD (secretin)
MRFFLVLLFSFFLLIPSSSSHAQATPSQSQSLEIFEEQPLITNVFYETELREALAAISGQSGINIIADQTVSGFITLDLIDVPFDEALRRILAPLGFTFRRMVGFYLVGAAYPDNPSFPLLSVTEKVVPNYLKAKNVLGLLSSFYQPFISVDTETNILTITASPEILQRIKEDLAKIDVPPRQVMIEALVTEFSKDARKSLGIDVGWFGEKGGRDLDVFFPVGDLLDSTLGLRYIRPDAKLEGWVGEFKGTVKALIQDGKINIRANPRVATIEGRAATIMIGKEEYYVIVTGVAPGYYGQLERVPVGVTLTIIPYISDKGEITVEIQPEVSDVVGTGATGLPVVSKRAVSTKIRVKDGETIVIGGLLQKNESTVRRKIPLLGDIPILGLLFSRTDRRVDEVETVIFITPHILSEETAGSESE